MPRLSSALPKYRLHKASGQAVVNLGGRDQYLGPYQSPESRQKYDRLIAQFLSIGRQSAVERGPTATVAEILLVWWQHAQTWYVKDGQPTNEVEAYRLLIRDIRQLYGPTPATDFGPIALRAVRQAWIDRGQSRQSCNKNLGRVKRIFRWAVSQELLPAHVHQALATVDGLKRGRCTLPEAPPIMPVELEVVTRTLEHLQPIVRDMVQLQLLTGCRPGELCKLHPAAVDRSTDVWEFRVAGHKTEHHGRARTIYLGPAAQEILAKYLLRDANAVCFSPAEAVKQTRARRRAQRVTPESCGNRPGKRSGGLAGRKARKPPGDAYTPDSYRRAVHNACDKAFPAPEPLGQRPGESEAARRRRLTDTQLGELKAYQSAQRWSPNQLRHTSATTIRKQFGLEGAQVILGHAKADVTQIYAERDAEKAREVARQIG